MLIPDTIVFSGDEAPLWLRMNARGEIDACVGVLVVTQALSQLLFLLPLLLLQFLFASAAIDVVIGGGGGGGGNVVMLLVLPCSNHTVSERDALAQLGNQTHEDEFVAFRKQVCWFAVVHRRRAPCRRLLACSPAWQSNRIPSSDDPSVTACAGNTTTVLTTRDLRDMLRPSRAGGA